jgi:predicted transcriptional regulator of viral defense system
MKQPIEEKQSIEQLALKRLGLEAVYHGTIDGKLYKFKELKKLLVGQGMSWVYAEKLLYELSSKGILKRVTRGLYEVDRRRLRFILDTPR